MRIASKILSMINESRKDQYYGMFDRLRPTDREYADVEAKFREKVKWAIQELGRMDRIVWFLRYAQFHFYLELLDRESNDPEAEKEYQKNFDRWVRKLQEEYSFPSRGDRFWGYLKEHLDDLGNTFTHFLSQNIRQFNDHVFTNEGLRIFLEWKEILDAHVEDTGGTIDAAEEASAHKVETFISFPDGWKWVLKHTKVCGLEGGALDHCGNRSEYARPGDELLSLREPGDGGRETPHLTFVLNNGEVSRGVGRSNSTPSRKYNSYIKALFMDPRIERVDQPSGLSDSDWVEIKTKNPNLEIEE
jgi:hypothetical protein